MMHTRYYVLADLFVFPARLDVVDLAGDAR